MRLTARNEWKFFVALPKAHPLLAAAWWAVIVARGLLGPAFGIAMGLLVAAVTRGTPLGGPLAIVAAAFVLLQVLPPIQHALSANLGDRLASWLYDRLTLACVRPPGMRHLEDPALTADLTVAREFDTGMTGPPLNIGLEFIAGGLVGLVGGVACAAALFAYNWWSPLVLGAAWGSTHWLLRESGVWWDRNTPEVRAAQRHAEYAFRLAVDPAPAKELRLFGLADWTIARFRANRVILHRLQYEATRLRERPMLVTVLVVVGANLLVFSSLAYDALGGTISLARLVAFSQIAVGTSMIAFGGLNWALDGAAAPVGAVLRLEDAMAPAGALPSGTRAAAGMPASEIRFRAVTFAYPRAGSDDPAPVLDGFDLTIRAGTSLAIVGSNGAGKTTLAKLLCRLYDPQAGSIDVDGVDVRELPIDGWRARVTAVFQDFTRFELSLRDNVAPAGAPDGDVRAALADAGAAELAALETVLARGYDGGIDLSGGQWQRIALARALCAVRQGAGLVLLDEPTAQLDVRGEMEIFERVLAATRGRTTILISHRFSTVRLADRICVLEHGRVVELGTHDELMALGGRYRTMFDLQAQRFSEPDEEGKTYDVLG
jgi:ABC-type transport system involved in cytochrome bd biosynthesis fused ATPase/permease subunit